MTKLIPHLTLATCALLLAGCASSGYQKAARTSSSLHDAAQGIDESLTPLDHALAALSDLSDNPRADITAQFKQYRSAVNKLESMSDEMHFNAAAMKTQGTAIFKMSANQSISVEVLKKCYVNIEAAFNEMARFFGGIARCATQKE